MRLTRLIPALATAALSVVALAPTASAQAPAPAAESAPYATAGTAGTASATGAAGSKARPIIGGGFASNAPWAARLFSNGRQTCSASIIAPTWILTARHCVSGGGLSFRIGSLDQTSGGTVANASAVYNHASSDLSLVRLDRSVQATYARLGQPGSVAVGQTVQVYGWGATSQCGAEINCQSRYLKVANVVVSGGCRDAYNGSAICARRGDGITAGGDSGGPMNLNGIQVGVASTSDRQTITAYTNVTAYRPWIQSIAGI
ncbi:trypsin-like serine protease [Streptomyces sp. NPDC000594]|uniref:S1 family peptidase n=1 Tax=Streptomyces sp. NPDC000594 TaxID=3154261 RepID=UPI00331C3B48